MKVYKTIFNGARPFKITINNNGRANVFRFNKVLDDYNAVPEISCVPDKLFIGKNTNHDGPPLLGNTVLLKTQNKYYYISDDIVEYKPKHEIVKYYSRMGNSEVPYPYAIDSEGNYHLLGELVVLKPTETLKAADDPYEYYYKHRLIWGIYGQQLIDTDISDFRIGEAPYNLYYTGMPTKEFKRLSKIGKLTICYENTWYELTRVDYADIMKKYAPLLFP